MCAYRGVPVNGHAINRLNAGSIVLSLSTQHSSLYDTIRYYQWRCFLVLQRQDQHFVFCHRGPCRETKTLVSRTTSLNTIRISSDWILPNRINNKISKLEKSDKQSSNRWTVYPVICDAIDFSSVIKHLCLHSISDVITDKCTKLQSIQMLTTTCRYTSKTAKIIKRWYYPPTELSMCCWIISPFNDFCCFCTSLLTPVGYKLQFCIFMFAVLLHFVQFLFLSIQY